MLKLYVSINGNSSLFYSRDSLRSELSRYEEIKTFTLSICENGQKKQLSLISAYYYINTGIIPN